MEYKKLSSRSKMSGDWYEVKLAMLVFLRSMNNRSISHFELATNVDETGAFDDIVYRIITTDQPEVTHTFFIQLKHKETATLGPGSFKSLSGDFGLNKYLKSFIEVRDGKGANSRVNNRLFQGQFQNFKFVVYTTATLQNKLLSNVIPVDLGLMGNILKTSVDEVMMFKFKRESYNEFVTLQENEKHLETQIVPFLEQFVLFVKQRSEHELDGLVKRELSCACLEAAAYEEPLYRITEGLFKRWWRDDKGEVLTRSSDILRRAIEKLSFEGELTRQTQQCTLDVQFDPGVWDTFNIAGLAEGESVLHVVSLGNSLRLTATKTLHALRGHQLSFTFVDLKYLLTRASVLVNEWENGYIDCLVIVVDDSKLHMEECFIFFITLSKKIKDILDKDSLKKCVIVSCANSMLANKIIQSLSIENVNTINDTFHKYDLDIVSRENLHKKTVSLQDYNVELQVLIEKGILETLLDEPLIEELVSSEGVLIGGHLPRVIPYFIPRHFKRNVLNKSILDSLTSADMLVLSGEIDSLKTGVSAVIPPLATGGGETGEVGGQALDKSEGSQGEIFPQSLNILFIPGAREAYVRYELVKHVRGNVHWLHVEYQTLNWIFSSRNIVLIQNHLNVHEMNVENLVELNDRVTVIIAEPGMGKTTLLSEMVRAMKGKNPCDWVIHLNLSEHCALFEPFESKKPFAALEFLSSALGVTPLEKAILQNGLERTGKVSVLLDSFDEVCPLYEEEACSLVRSLLRTHIRKLIVTSRHCSEDTLKLLLVRSPVNLIEFSEEDQRSFFEKFWAGSATPQRLDFVITKVIDTMNTIDPEKKIMGIPLQTMMVAEVFHDYVVDPENNDFSENLDIIDLYEKFIEKKFKIFYTKIKDKTLRKLEIKTNFQKDHMYSAMMLLFSQEEVQTFSTIDNIIERASMFLSQTDEARDNSGIVIRSINNKPVFIHKTFAEYFAALCFSVFYELNTQFLRDHIFRPDFHFVRLLFDHILAKGHSLHEAVLNQDMYAIERLLEGGVDVDNKDSGGRTALHLASALGMKTISALPLIIYFDDSRFIGPVNQHPVRVLLEHGASVNIPDQVMQLTPLDYALETSSWDAAELLLARGGVANVYTLMGHRYGKILAKLVNNILCNGYVHSVRKLLAEGMPFYYKILHGADDLLLQRASFVGYTDVVTVLLDTGFPHIIDTRIDGNRLGYSSLIYACRAMQCHIVRLLILKGANYLHCSRYGYSCLHLTCFWGYTRVVETLLDAVTEIGGSETEFINFPNSDGEFALSIANDHHHMQIVELLLSRGADISVLNSSGFTCLNVACIRGDARTIRALVERVTSDGASAVDFINALSTMGKTPLSMACRYHHCDVVRLLVALGANYRACDTDGYSCLHRYCVWGDVTMVRVLVDSVKEKGDSVQEFVNALNAEGDPPLSLARRYNNNDVVEFLLYCGAQSWDDVIKALCNACITNDPVTVQTIIGHVKDKEGSVEEFLNVWHESGRSPLGLACRHHSVQVVEVLLAHGCDALAVDANGSPCLHIACDKGDLAITSMLVAHMTAQGMSIDTPNMRGETALSRACRYCHLEVARLLLSHGADAVASDQGGYTSLHNACAGGDATVVQTLVDHLRDQGRSVDRFINTLSISGVSPMDLAFRHNQLGVINYFLSLRERIRIKRQL